MVPLRRRVHRMKTPDLSWQAVYAAEYARTSGNVMIFGAVQPGGMWPVSFSGPTAQTPLRIRRGEAIASTERLRARESFVAVAA